MSNIDLDQLAAEIRSMSIRSQLYKVLKRELLARGWWKNRRRHSGQIEHITGKHPNK